ncbi:MAG TPA: hypothetical protein VJB59_02415 [Bdellovibrionota bacterium]|nr:hypothetical protein [Bdellovibrionota bacterium]
MKEGNVKPENSDSKQAQDVAEAGVRRKIRQEPQSHLLKITLPEEVSNRVSDALKTLKERGQECKPDELLAPILMTITQERLDKLILQHTPDEYYLEKARELPELNAIFIKQAKRAILNKGVRRRQRKSKMQLNPVVEAVAGVTKVGSLV